MGGRRILRAVAPVVAVALTAALAAVGCGGRTSRREVLQMLRDTGQFRPGSADAPTIQPGVPPPAALEDQTGPLTGAPAARSAGPSPGQSVGSSRPSAAPGRTPAKVGSPIPTPVEAPSSGAQRPAIDAASTGPGPSAVPGSGAAAVPTGGGSPILLGEAGTWSGPVGAAVKELITGVRVWVKDVNARGGVAGHPIQLVVADDGGDPARYQAILRDMVETRKVFAFIGNSVVLTGTAGREYLEQQRVPVIGGDIVNPVWTGSSMYFPEGATLNEFVNGTVLATAKFTDKKRVGFLTCQEAEPCRVAAREWPATAKKIGLDVVYEGKASVAQPDFTAECLNGRNAGAEIMLVGMDAASLLRWGKACHQIDYRPRVGIPSAAVDAKLQGDVAGGIFEGLVAVVNNAPFFLADRPGPAEFQAAMAKYAAGAVAQLPTIEGWTSGKLFERAGAALGAEPSRESFLTALWSLQNETLGGLAPPLTFARNQPSPPVRCFFVIQIHEHKFSAPLGSEPICP